MKNELITKLKTLGENCTNKSKNVYAYFYPNEVRNMIRAERKIKFKVGETKHEDTSLRVKGQTKTTAVSEDCVEAWKMSLSNSSVNTDHQLHLMMEHCGFVRVDRKEKNSTEWFEVAVPESMVKDAFDYNVSPEQMNKIVSNFIIVKMKRIVFLIENMIAPAPVASVSVIEKPVYMNHYAIEMIGLRDWYNSEVRIKDLTYVDSAKSNQPYVMDFETAHKMISYADLCKYMQPSVLVVEAVEFVYTLVKMGYNPAKITLATSSDKKAKEMRSMLVGAISTDAMKNKDKLGAKMKFDVCLQNPPFAEDLKFVNIGLEVADRVVAIHPCSTITNRKEVRRSNDAKAFLTYVSKYDCSWEYIGFDCFSADISSPVGITYINKLTKLDRVRVIAKHGKYTAETIDQVNMYGEWLLPFYNITFADSVDDHKYMNGDNEPEYKNGKWFVCTLWKRFTNAVVSDSRLTNNSWLSWEFSTKEEADNFLSYTKTLFFRSCLATLKMNGNLHRGELKSIPWLDFTQSWDDEKLFNHFGITEEQRNAIPVDFAELVR
ncbi:hypothetical protein Ah1_00104 [Aeromonas phage Ah1]|uniref:Uncharacterized protein n=1 Tax=Aeromonas phage Ah1 TaxID=2053701 RepID=A0A2H4YF94_9CAUD|nr:hypothetical protein KNT77_gp104 [Aeromonas phage Ah1]AUE22645.1 hypothetical protein Ah1_00104 [Aeromonas phage Ah1]